MKTNMRLSNNIARRSATRIANNNYVSARKANPVRDIHRSGQAGRTRQGHTLNTNKKSGSARNYWTGSLAGLACLLALSPVGAQTQNVSGSVEFKTTNQSMWGSGSYPPVGFVYPYTLMKAWNTGNVGSSNYKAGFGGEASASSNGSAGLNLNTWASAGSVNVDCLCNVGLTPPTTLKAGQSFSIPSSWTYTGTMSTQSPQIGASVAAMINAGASATLKAKAFSAQVFGRSVGLGINYSLPLVTLDTGSLTGSLDVKNLGIVTGNGHIPRINTSGSGGTGAVISGFPPKISYANRPLYTNGSDHFLTLDGDITQLMTTVLGWGSFKYDQSLGVPHVASLNWGYNFLDLYGEISLTAEQDFTFTPTPTITLTFSCANNAPVRASFAAGTTYTGTLPTTFTGPVSVTASVDISNSNQFASHTNLIVNPGLYFLPLDVYVKGSGLPGLEFEPVSTIDVVSNAYPIPVFNQTFKLGGFSAQSLPGFTMNVN